MNILIKNNAFGFLAAGVSATDTEIQLQPGDGGNFPNVGSNEYFYATIQSISGEVEIVKVVGWTSDVLTVVRAQEGTSALSFAAGSRIELRVTAQSVRDLAAQLVRDGNAATATKLQTARTINGVPFDGSASITIADGTKLPLAGGTLTGKLTTAASAAGGAGFNLPHGAAPTTPSNGDVWTTTSGVFARVNGATKTVAFTDSSITGNAATATTATKLQTARTITVGNTGKSFDGSANVSWSLSEILGVGVPETAQELAGGVDLNTVQTPGFYVQSEDADAASGTNYPVALAGALVVIKNATGVSQLYYTYGSASVAPRAFFRALSSGSWSTWRENYHSGNLGAASETAAGIVRLATAAAAQAGTDGTMALSPLRLRDALNASGSAPIYACRAWVNFNGTGTVAIRASGNVSSITDNGVGDYTINFTTALPDANYSVASSAGNADSSSTSAPLGIAVPVNASSCRLGSWQSQAVGNRVDFAVCQLAVFR